MVRLSQIVEGVVFFQLTVLLFACVGAQLPAPTGTKNWGSPSEPMVVDVREFASQMTQVFYLAEANNVEYSLCLTAEKDVVFVKGLNDKSIPIASYRVSEADPPIRYASIDSLSHQFKCPERTDGWMHTHPILDDGTLELCSRSPVDLSTFWKNGYKFMIVWCGPNTFRWYTRNGSIGEAEIFYLAKGNLRVEWELY